jgi:chromosome segregation ATPase
MNLTNNKNIKSNENLTKSLKITETELIDYKKYQFNDLNELKVNIKDKENEIEKLKQKIKENEYEIKDLNLLNDKNLQLNESLNISLKATEDTLHKKSNKLKNNKKDLEKYVLSINNLKDLINEFKEKLIECENESLQ